MTRHCERVCPCANPCPFTAASNLLGKKWRAYIIHNLSINGPMRFGELKRAIPSVTSNMLASSLQELERWGLIERHQYDEMPVRVEYELTEKIEPALRAMDELTQWALDIELCEKTDTQPNQRKDSHDPHF